MKNKVKVKDQVIKLTDMTHWEVRHGVLYNLNTKHDEAVEGDIVEYTIGESKYRGHVKGYTCHQFVETYEWGLVVLSAADYNVRIIHQTKVEEVEN